MPTYTVLTKAFIGGVLRGPGTGKPTYTCDKPFKVVPPHLKLVAPVANASANLTPQQRGAQTKAAKKAAEAANATTAEAVTAEGITFEATQTPSNVEVL